MGQIDHAVVQQPVQGESTSGDACLVLESPDQVLVAVIDGLGHGKDAHEAAQAALACIRANENCPLDTLLTCCHEALRHTRGAVIAVARIDRRQHRLVHAGIGNIETRIIGAQRSYHPVSINGIAGHTLRKIRCETFPFEPGDLLVMHSDGISDRFDLSALARERDLQLLASQLVHAHGRHHDDQLLLILRETP